MATPYIQPTSESDSDKRQSTRDDKDSLRNYNIGSPSSSSPGSSPYIQPISESDASQGESSLQTPTSIEQARRLEQQRQSSDSNKSSKQKRTAKRTIAEKKKALEPKKYYARQTRRDGTILYYNRQGDVIREINPRGVIVIRVRGSGPNKGQRVKRVTAEIIIEQRTREAYSKELRQYEKEYRAEVKRVNDLKALGGYVGQYLALTGASKSLSNNKKQSLRTDVSRYISPYEIGLIAQLKESAELVKEVEELDTGKPLTPSEKRRLLKIEKRLKKLKANREKLAASQKKVRDKIVNNLGGDKEKQKWVGKALRELPAAGTNFLWHFIPSIYQAGMELSSFVDIATAPKIVRQKLNFKENTIKNLKGVASGFDPRKPENLFNIMLLGTSLTSIAKAGVKSTVLNKQLKGAKITKGTTVITRTTKGADAIIKGNLKLPSVKVLGKTYPAKVVPFETLQRLTNKAMASNAYKIQGSTKYLLKQAAKTIQKGKIKNVQINKPKTVLYKGEGKINLRSEINRAIKNPKAYAKGITKTTRTKIIQTSKGPKRVPDYSLPGKQRLSTTTFKQKVLLKKKGLIGGKGKSIKTKGVITNKAVKAKQQVGIRAQSRIKTNIKQLTESNDIIKFKYTTEFTKLPPKTYASLIRGASRSIGRKLSVLSSKLKNTKLTPKQIMVLKKQKLNLKANYSTVKQVAAKYIKVNKKLFTSKKGQISIGRDGLRPGATGSESYLQSVKKDFSRVDSILKRLDKIDIAKKALITKKVSTTSRVSPQLRFVAKKFDPSIVFNGYKLITKPLLSNSIIPLLRVTSQITSNIALLSNIKGLSASQAPITPGVKPGVNIGLKTPTKPVVKTGAKASTVTKESIMTTPIKPLLVSPLIANRYLPFIGGLPIPGLGASGRVFSIPLNRFLQAQKYRYSADLYSKLYGIKAKKSERENLLRAKRLFSGLEIRKIV